jgi:rubrerythrin
MAEWVEKTARLGSNYKLYGCSECGWTFTFKPDYNYCPRCGSYMKAATDTNVGGKVKEGAENES